MVDPPRESSDRENINAKVATSMNLLRLRLSKINSSLLEGAPTKPLELSRTVVSVEMSLLNPFVIYDITYDLLVTDSEKNDTLEASLEINILLKLHSGKSLTKDELLTFGSVGAVGIAHPYVREIIHSLSGRMGLPALVLNLGPPVPSMMTEGSHNQVL